jgi:hypothetical protein
VVHDAYLQVHEVPNFDPSIPATNKA